MKSEKIFNVLNDVSDEYIEEARTTKLKKQTKTWKQWTAIAAALVALVGVGGMLLQGLPFGGNAAPGGDSAGGGAGHNEGSVFMSYAGPVFPLTLQQEDADISATRNIAYDFALADEDNLRVWGASVTDSYTFTNPTAEEKTITAVYPFTGSFYHLDEITPTIAVHGATVSPKLYAGGYSGAFQGVYGGDDIAGSHNLEQLSSWEDYKRLLEDGSYLADAFADITDLNLPVTVYTFSDIVAPEEYEAATQAISFTIDPEKTTFIEYGFNGLEIGDDGFRRYSYFARNGSDDTNYLIVIGEDIAAYSLQGYQNGGCEAGTELDGVSATVTRSERILADVLREVTVDFIAQYMWRYDEGAELKVPVTMELFHDAVSEFLQHYGILSADMRDRYEGGRMEDLLQDALAVNRVFYSVFESTIPAGGSLDITATMHKMPSYDFHGAGSGNEGIQGYEMVTRLGTNLRFEAINAEILSTENMEIVRQNFGFELENGISQVTLDPAVEHYYIEIRPVGR